jgi:hypothetical protein
MFPQMKKCLRGWCRKKTVVTYTFQTVDFEQIWIPTDYEVWVNYQPMPAQRVDKKPEEERQWKFWDIIIDGKLKLNIKDWIVIDEKNFQVMSINDWSMCGFYHYECVESFMPTTA